MLEAGTESTYFGELLLEAMGYGFDKDKFDHYDEMK